MLKAVKPEKRSETSKANKDLSFLNSSKASRNNPYNKNTKTQKTFMPVLHQNSSMAKKSNFQTVESDVFDENFRSLSNSPSKHRKNNMA